MSKDIMFYTASLLASDWVALTSNVIYRDYQDICISIQIYTIISLDEIKNSSSETKHLTSSIIQYGRGCINLSMYYGQYPL